MMRTNLSSLVSVVCRPIMTHWTLVIAVTIRMSVNFVGTWLKACF